MGSPLEAKESFLAIRMVEVGTPQLKNLQKFCAERGPVILHPELYRVLKLTYPMDVGSIVLDGRMTTEMETGSL